MVFVVLDREGPGSRRVTMTPRAIRRLQDLRRELLSQPLGPVASDVVTPAVGSQRSPPRNLYTASGTPPPFVIASAAMDASDPSCYE